MSKLITSKNLSNDAIIKSHHQYHHQHQLQEHNLQLKTIQTKQSQSVHQLQQTTSQQQQQQQHKQKQESQSQQEQRLHQQHQQQQQYSRHHNNSTSKTKVKEINSYEKFTGSNTIKSISDIQPSKVKMSGYLKKKRTKVGGWRKMWFVLQNQLLLSYSSKENYDKKLVSFKDVLNLVPGTTIHPLGSFRFAIETTTNVMYNFRCDDSQSYNQWLNALVESLSLNLQQQRTGANKDNSSVVSTSENNNCSSRQQKFKNSISLDNIQRTTPPNKKPIKSCNSSDSISRFNLSRTPNIPIADATAKILQRNGIPSTGTNNVNELQTKKIGHNDRHRNGGSSCYNNDGNCSSNNDGNRNNRQHHDQLETCCEKQERARNFRLHEKRLSSGMLQQNLHQSDEVSRINRMFSRSRSANNVATATTNSTFNILHDRNSFVVSTTATTTTTPKTTTSIATITSSSISSTTAATASSPCSSIVNIVNNPIVNKVKPSLSSSSLPLSTSSIITTASGTSVGIASIVSLKEGNGRYNIDNKQPRKNLLNCNVTDFINHNGNNYLKNYIGALNLDNHNQYYYNNNYQLSNSDFNYKLKSENTTKSKLSQHEKYLNQNCNNKNYYRDTNLINNSNNNNYRDSNNDQNKNILKKSSDRRNSNQFFPIMLPTNNIMTKDNNPIFNDEKDIIIPVANRNNTTSGNNSYSNNSSSNNSNNSSSGYNNSNRSSPIKCNNHTENKNNSDNNDSKNLHKNINDGNNGDKNGSSCNIINKNNFKNSANDLRDLNQNRMFGDMAEYYEKIDDFQKDKDDDDAYECYPLQQKMQDLNICKHQQQQQQQKQNEVELHNKSDKRMMTQNSEKSSISSLSSTSSPFKKSISLERGGQNPFYNEPEFSTNSMNPFINTSSPLSSSSPHQSLQIFSHINSPGKDEISLSSSSTTTSNSRCNSSLVTTESNNSMTNSPTNDGSLIIQQQQQQQQRLQCSYTNRPKILDSRIHPALQPSESMEEDLHILVHNDGDGESHTEDIILHNDIDEQRPASAQCLSSIHNGKGTEPIYALVDLKNKHARRAKLKELQDQLKMLTEARDRERPRSLQCISSDYEEVLNFECMQDEDDGEEEDEDEDENENIYEPINIPEYAHHRQQQHNQRHALWKYFRRINIEALLELARNKKVRSPRNATKTKYEGTNLHPTMSLPPDAYSHHQNEQTSPFSDIRRKLGNHRKSIKLRMKRFYNRHDIRNTQNVHANAIIKERNAFSDDELDSQGATGSTGSGASENSLKSSDGTNTTGNEEKRTSSSFVFGEIDKYRRSQKQFFGSLTRLKKTRTSISLEEGETKNFIVNENNSGSGNNNNSNNILPSWLSSPKMNRSPEGKISISNKVSKKGDELPNDIKSN